MRLMARAIGEHGARREAAWVLEHGEHEYDRHALLDESLEELADAYNYMRNVPSSVPGDKRDAVLAGLADLYDSILSLRQECGL